MRKAIIASGAGLALLVGPGPASASDEGEGSIEFVPMAEISVPIVDGARADGTLRIKLVLEPNDAPSVAKVNAAAPALRAASLSTAIEFARLYASPMMPVDAQRLSADLDRNLHAIEPSVRRALLVEVSATRA